MACTTILVGKNVSYDGSTLVARNEDSPSKVFTPKKFVVVKKEEQPREYVSKISKVKISLPDNPLKYTAYPNAVYEKEGIWGAFGVNELNISMTATETITSNERVLAADPLVEGGIGEEDIVTITLPYIKSARDGVVRLGKLLEEYGTYEMNGIAFQDENEIWWLETIGGHHFIAKRVPDDAYVVMPNQLGIDDFDLEDAFGEMKNHICSSDLKDFIDNNHLNLNLDDKFNPRLAFGSNSDADHIYNTPRAWIIQKFFNEDVIQSPVSDNIAWSMKPNRKITNEDVKRVLSLHFQGTDYDPYSKHSDPLKKAMFRPIGINRNNVYGLVQIRPYMPDDIKSIEWIAVGSNTFNAQIPQYAMVDTTPDYLSKTSDDVVTSDFYWSNRIIAALADANYSDTANLIERYQLKLQELGNSVINKYDKIYLETKDKKVLEKANEEVANIAKKETDKLLQDVLYVASCNMKNGFARSDA
ncbi:C69 family dipeptidase [Oceanivirga miroungae]|uniref:Dipeptidase n=1 Tax=Oceanivirga miroungae TaxID=1130046 RepID=A0A6I8MEI3_9FUSO|nr:C69 family dipeptidase [Oceanivirga miroungae]VWL85628.1 Dipeptidase [Oceanivirga miroungae]